jgi:apolipoprotein N-acyltransferase
LKNLLPPRILRARWPWAFAGGIMLAMAQPKFELAGFAWIAPAILLLATFGSSPKEAFRAGYIAGFAQQLITLSWLLNIPFPVGAVAGWLAVSAYLALYPAIWCWLAWKFFPFPVRGLLLEPTPTDRFTETSLFQRLTWSLLCAATWVTMEMMAARMIGGFPWNFLGTSQFRMLPLIQIASITSVYGISFVMVWFSCAVFSAGMMLTRQQSRWWILDMVAPLVAIVALLFFGLAQIRAAPTHKRHVKVALVQPSIPQNLIFDPTENTNRFNALVRLSELALEAKPQILIWPEAAVPTMLRYDTNTSNAVINLATNHHVWAIVGTDDAIPRNFINPDADKVDYYNSAFAISPQGELTGAYRKRLLVIFGEFVPFIDWLPFMKYLSPVGDASFSRGTERTPFHLPDLDVTTSSLICFEDTFAHFARAYVTDDTDFLLNLTNNGWFGESAAQWQHAAAAMFRAIENRIPLVRCTNNGLTCWIDEVGVFHQIYIGDSKDIYGPCFKTAEIPLLDGKRELTFYTRHGDVFGWACVGFTTLAWARRTATRSRRNHP